MKNIVPQKKQIDWLAILRGLAVVLVIIYHVPTDEIESLEQPFVIFNDIFSFRMPLFFFISGYLLYYTKIRKNGSFSSIIKERIPRIVIPYIFITMSVFFIKYFAGYRIGIPNMELSLMGIINIFLYPLSKSPWDILWFLNVVLIFFLCYPLLKLSLKNVYSAVSTLVFLILIHYFAPKEIELLDLSYVFFYFVFFYFGLFLARFELHKYAPRKDVLILCLIIMASVKILEYNNIIQNTRFIYSIPGILVSINFAMQCEKVRPTLFSSFRKYYYQIYLWGKFFQSPIFIIYGIISNNIFIAIVFIIISVTFGLYGPVLLCKIAEKLNWKPLMRVLGF